MQHDAVLMKHARLKLLASDHDGIDDPLVRARCAGQRRDDLLLDPLGFRLTFLRSLLRNDGAEFL
jgi:hypothetical protein